jgi:hypothetical protein
LSPLRNWRTSKPLQEVAPGVHVVRLPGLARDIYSLDWHEAVVEVMLDAMAAALLLMVSMYGVRDAVALVNYPSATGAAWMEAGEGLPGRSAGVCGAVPDGAGRV